MLSKKKKNQYENQHNPKTKNSKTCAIYQIALVEDYNILQKIDLYSKIENIKG